MFEHWFRFLSSAILILAGLLIVAFVLTAIASVLLPATGLIIAPVAIAYLAGLRWLWTETVPTNEELIHFANEKAIAEHNERISSLQTQAAAGDAKSAEHLGGAYERGLSDSYRPKNYLVQPNKELALHFYETAGRTRTSASKKGQ